MKKNRRFATCFVMASAVSAMVLSGCGEEDRGRGRLSENAPAHATQPPTAPETTQGSEPVTTPETTPTTAPAPISGTYVSDVGSFLEAIEPGAEIVLAPGTYNLTEYIGYASFTINDYVETIPVSGGTKLSISHIDGLTIRGLDGEHTEIVIEPRDACVLSFNYCTDIILENLTIGHTEQAGECEGEVLSFYNCANIDMKGMDLYGCGSYGIYSNKTMGMHVTDSTIRDCSSGAIDIQSCADHVFDHCNFKENEVFDLLSAFQGDPVFNNCSFTKNNFEHLIYNNDSLFSFYGCNFGPEETESLDFELSSNSEQNIIYDANCRFSRTMTVSQVLVSDVESLVESIAPDTIIIVEPGEYNLSEYLEDIWENEGEQWNKNHDYVEIREVYDGVELVVKNTGCLTIAGASTDRDDTKILVDPEYAAVMTYEDGFQLNLANLTVGHTTRGECAGNVIDFLRCRDVFFTNMDIFGCGVIGVTGTDCLGKFQIIDSKIHDCSRGPLYLENSTGMWYFFNSELVDSDGECYFEEQDHLSLYFTNCTFGETETQEFMYRNDTTAENCLWAEDE